MAIVKRRGGKAASYKPFKISNSHINAIKKEKPSTTVKGKTMKFGKH